jgi:nitrite reductase/ring-hydroxylating ferredoxin subunit
MDQADADSCSACITRRAMLRGGAVGAALIALPLGCTASSHTPGPIPGGNVADLRVGSLQVVNDDSVFLARDTEGLYAMTRVCTHQGQLVSILSIGPATVLHCFGHGSEFDTNGGVITGPATRPLEHLRVDLAADGTITIQGDQFVTTDTRTPVG